MNFQLNTIFCDDIRLETSGKVSLIGCYGPTLLAKDLPIRLPKLCAQIELRWPIDETLDNIILELLYNGKSVLFLDNINLSDRVTNPLVPSNEPNFIWRAVISQFVLECHEIAEAGYFELRATIEGEAHIGGRLRVRKQPSEQ